MSVLILISLVRKEQAGVIFSLNDRWFPIFSGFLVKMGVKENTAGGSFFRVFFCFSKAESKKIHDYIELQGHQIER